MKLKLKLIPVNRDIRSLIDFSGELQNLNHFNKVDPKEFTTDLVSLKKKKRRRSAIQVYAILLLCMKGFLSNSQIHRNFK